MSKKSEIATSLYCQTCGERLLWQNQKLEPQLESDGTLRGFTLHAACIHCKSKYTGWLYVGAAPQWWEQKRADNSSSARAHADLKNYQRASVKRKKYANKAKPLQTVNVITDPALD